MLTGFSSMVNSINLQSYPRDNMPVSRADYEQWRQEFVFDALQGLRYGQSFCNRFDITDNILFYEQDPEWADTYIRNYYLS
jgi:hypothetical protein